MTSLPPLADALHSKELLNEALSILFEPSDVLRDNVVPLLVNPTPPPKTYTELIDLTEGQLKTLPPLLQATFIAGHPRIGEVKGLSALSAKEQASVATPPAVLKRLAHLNTLYEKKFEGLVYVVFVNGRSRAEIIPLIEEKLNIGPAEEGKEDQPPVDAVVPFTVADEAWLQELDRAVADVALIAKARLRSLTNEFGAAQGL